MLGNKNKVGGNENMKTIRVGFLGLGNIGGGVSALIGKQNESFAKRYGIKFEIVKALVRDTNKQRRDEARNIKLTTDAYEIINDAGIDMIVEFIGGQEPAREYLLAALKNGKTVVTANKVVIAACWDELDAAARASGAGLYYEASAAGGIPVIGAINRSLQANDIQRLIGIVNGTTNAILTDMSQNKKTYKQALQSAQEKGYAEPDPTMDVSGGDAVSKLSILASLAFGKRIYERDIFCEGIENIHPEDIDFGKQFGMVLKLLAISKMQCGKLQLRVHPAFISSEHPLASVSGAFNAVFIDGDAIGQSMFYGRGAGDMPTASAIVSDMLVAANAQKHERPAFFAHNHINIEIEKDWRTAFYLNLRLIDQPGALGKVTTILGSHGISLSTVNQVGTGMRTAPVIIVTHPAKESSMRAAISQLKNADVVDDIISTIRVEGDI